MKCVVNNSDETTSHSTRLSKYDSQVADYGGAPRQRGSTLIMSLIVLVVLMMIGVTTMMMSGTQSTLSGNLQFQDLALNRAEIAVANGEQWLAAGANYKDAGLITAPNPATPHLYPVGAFTADPLAMTWSNANSKKVDDDDETQRYFIELLGKDKRLTGAGAGVGGRASSGCNQVNVYRIVSRGAGGRGAVRFVQSNYSVLSC